MSAGGVPCCSECSPAVKKQSWASSMDSELTHRLPACEESSRSGDGQHKLVVFGAAGVKSSVSDLI